jgi:hypothetical protein
MSMTSRIMLAAVILGTACTATIASAGGVNIAWNDCAGAGGTWNRSFACNTNAGSSVLVCSFDPPEGIAKLTGGSAWIYFAGNTMPDWWRFDSGACRVGALSISFDPSTCLGPWAGAAVGSFSYEVGLAGHPNVARLAVSWGVPEGAAGPVEPGWEYTAFQIIIDHGRGFGTCVGCLDPMCIGFDGLWLYQPAGMSNYFVCNPLYTDLATWQGGAVGSGCPGTDQSPLPLPSLCSATPVPRRSWGQLKSLYR